MRPVSVSANGTVSQIEQLQAALRGQWRQAARAAMVLLSLRGLPPSQVAALLDCHPATVRRWIGRSNDEGAAGLADRPRPGRPRPGRRRLTSRIARLLQRPGPWTLPRTRRRLEVTTGEWACRLGRRCAGDFTALPEEVLRAFPLAPLIVVICDNDSTRHARTVTAYLQDQPRLELLRRPVQPARQPRGADLGGAEELRG
jgi:transposase